jgi:hypothetical protein
MRTINTFLPSIGNFSGKNFCSFSKRDIPGGILLALRHESAYRCPFGAAGITGVAIQSLDP